LLILIEKLHLLKRNKSLNSNNRNSTKKEDVPEAAMNRLAIPELIDMPDVLLTRPLSQSNLKQDLFLSQE
jgi:hypothetical protein